MLGHANALTPGSVLRQYETIDVLGMGGFGITYRAMDQDLHELVAIKEYLPSDLAHRQGDSTVTARSKFFEKDFEWGLNRFLDEAIALARFRHSNIVRVKQYFKQNGTGYLVMEYEKGESLEDTLKRSTSLSEADTKRILFPILDGLKKVHEQEYLHRDIKPANIIVRENDGGPVLIDFGAARQAIGPKTRAITAVLTPGYAPLEQYSPDDNQGPWTDIYALGGVAYRCLTGEKPPDATMRVRKDPLIPLATAAKSPVSPQFAHAIEWALRVEETARPQTIDEFSAALLSGDPVPFASGETKVSVRKDKPRKAKRQREKAELPPAPDSKRVGPASNTIVLVPGDDAKKSAPTDSGVAPPPPPSKRVPPAPGDATIVRPPISSRKVPASPAPSRNVPTPAAASPAPAFSLFSKTPAKRASIYLAGAAGAILLVAIVVGVSWFTPGTNPGSPNPQGPPAQEAQEQAAAIREEVEQAWNRAVTADTVAGYDEFIAQYGVHNMHVAEAEAARERARPEEADWQRALEQQTVSAYQQYLYSFPTGKHQADAEFRISVRMPELETAEDEAGKAAVIASAIAPCREYLTSYPDGRHVQVCQNRISTVPATPAQPRPPVLPPLFVEYQSKLVALGGYRGPVASAFTDQLTAAIISFQSQGGLTQNGIFDTPTMAAIDAALANLESAHSQAKERRTRRDYEAFVRNYPSSAYTQDVRNRILQCRVETRAGPPIVSPIQNEQRVEDAQVLCEAANAKAQEEARNACIARGGQATSVSVLKSEEVGGGLFRRRACVATAEAQCSTPGPQIQADVCP